MTCACALIPMSAATSGRTGPMIEPLRTSGGSRAALIPAILTRTGSYSIRSRSRLSVSHDAVIDIGEAAATPLNRIVR